MLRELLRKDFKNSQHQVSPYNNPAIVYWGIQYSVYLKQQNAFLNFLIQPEGQANIDGISVWKLLKITAAAAWISLENNNWVSYTAPKVFAKLT